MHDTRIIHTSGPWAVLAQRFELMFLDGSIAHMHPVQISGADAPLHRAVHHEGLRWIIIDLRHHCAHVQGALERSPERDAPGIVFNTLRHRHATARAFTDAIALSHVHAWWQHDAAPLGAAA